MINLFKIRNDYFILKYRKNKNNILFDGRKKIFGRTLIDDNFESVSLSRENAIERVQFVKNPLGL